MPKQEVVQIGTNLKKRSIFDEKINKTAKIATVLLLVACLSITCAANAFAENYANIDNVRIAQIENVGSDGSKLKTNILDNGENELVASNFSYDLLNNGDLELVGEVNNITFDVNAVPYNTPANENVQVYEGFDQSSNYQVLYVALEKEISESVKYFDDVNCEAYRCMVKLYMRTNGSDDIIIEVFTNEDCFSDQMDQAQVSTYLTDAIDDDPGKINQFWYAKVFEPIEEYSEGISPRVMYEDINESTYTYIFDVFGRL